MSRRDAPRQGEPVDVDASFPGRRPRRRTWFRAHAWREGVTDGGCWFYASLPAAGGGGRFDLPAPRGTCYWASSELAAARERLGRAGGFVAHDEVARVRVSTAQFDAGRLADLLHVDAARRGVTQELSSSAPYEVSQRWAAAFSAAGFDGVRYQPRFSSDRVEAVALFGRAGAPSRPRRVASSRPIADVLVEHGYTVLAAPRVSELGPLLG